jgi:rhodanese-related sulfurtransferase
LTAPLTPASVVSEADKATPSVPLPKDTIVIDVRDDDRVGGHIAGSIHVPSETFLTSVDDLIHDPAVSGAKKVVFHCALSKER